MTSNLHGGHFGKNCITKETWVKPHTLLSRISCGPIASAGVPGWNTYAIVAVIDLARGNRENPDVPNWLREDYFGAIHLLAERAAHDVLRVKDPDVIRAVLSVLAIAAGARTHARFLLNYSGEELLEIERLASDNS